MKARLPVPRHAFTDNTLTLDLPNQVVARSLVGLPYLRKGVGDWQRIRAVGSLMQPPWLLGAEKAG